MDDKRAFLRHTLATVAYRGGKAVRNAPASFAGYAIGDAPKTPAQILAHIGDLFDWALSIAKGKQAWNNSAPRELTVEIGRCHAVPAPSVGSLASRTPLKLELDH